MQQKGPVDVLAALGGFAGLGAALANAQNASQTGIIYALGSAAGALGAVALYGYANKRANNYVTIFYNCKEKEAQASGRAPGGVNIINSKVSGSSLQATPQESGSGELFKKGCDVVVFQVIDSHDYWNLSQLLTARTGLEFVAEGAEKGSAAPPK